MPELYANINTQQERQIKNIERATQAELARLALTQDAEEHKRTMKRAKLGRQLAAGTITQEEYDRSCCEIELLYGRELYITKPAFAWEQRRAKII